MPRFPFGLISLVILSSACGCILGSDPGKSQDEAIAAKAPPAQAQVAEKVEARVASEWQTYMLEALAKEPKGSNAYGLFSAGGWSNSGQVMVIVGPGGATQKLLLVANNKQEVTTQRVLTKNEWAKLEAQLKVTPTLVDIDIEAFDLLIYEYVHAVIQNSGTAEVVDRLYIKNPGTKKMPKHDALIDAFQALKGATK